MHRWFVGGIRLRHISLKDVGRTISSSVQNKWIDRFKIGNIEAPHVNVREIRRYVDRYYKVLIFFI